MSEHRKQFDETGEALELAVWESFKRGFLFGSIAGLAVGLLLAGLLAMAGSAS